MFNSSDFITAKMYKCLHSCCYSTAKKLYAQDREILGVKGRKIVVREYCRLYGLTLVEFNSEYSSY